MNVRIMLALLVAGLLSGCAGMNNLRAEVSTFGEWPVDRKAGTYTFERLPSQQAQAAVQETLEAAARPALEAAGFKPAEDGAEPDVLVQVGGRVSNTGYSGWYDPFWAPFYYPGYFYGAGRRWHGYVPPWGGYGYWGAAGWWPYGYFDPRRYEREVALLIRDRSSGKPIYEARGSSDGFTSGSAAILRAMFEAALKDFPAVGISPRSVLVQLPG